MENKNLLKGLKLLLDYIESRNYLPSQGLCTYTYILKVKKLINQRDHDLLVYYIRINMPHDYMFFGETGVYGWPKDDIQSRIEFLQHHIKLLEE